ncbi:MAG: pirin family protein [Bauldia sp.]|uniref:pirin family protein n=1 Tax=Bauldia sp. TaxID=2575872 RepID=UPI001E1A035C|nr:pirin family protein [Bauldia sp.]MCB1494570.1 pirin family protein [Bauldia sp.]
MRPLPMPDPGFGDAGAADLIDAVVVPRTKDLGGFTVGRVLPAIERRMVGPFILMDQAGPAEILMTEKFDVRPHPHIGLATVTYIHDGAFVHRDSIGNEQTILPGEVNWMTAGSGIAHSERGPREFRGERHKLFGFQTWVALPREHEEAAPTFTHHGRDALPVFGGDGATVRLIVGSLYGERSPVETFSDMFYADVTLEAGARLPIDAGHEERAAYVVEGAIEVGGDRFDATRLVVFKPGDSLVVRALAPTRLMLLGGEAMDGPRHIWWNFVSSSKERIEEAKNDWKLGRFDKVFGDEEEFIPMPD